ncbi:hypothetical protein ACTOWA_00545 [Herbaspirillum seropedicae]|uniref:hypothetical protein n=1 Tax=Herbaspirillum seropedicae TaxID=964 RepID=UPI00285E7956|nr:hypothetical protein [Herbaspirillum seropedicae]MDR6397918.1 cell wall assembly regulator SMI1 [Herbaspirillum seropedicae]
MAAGPATQDEIRKAIMTVLGTLPPNMQFHFYWKDGRQYMSMKVDGEPEQIMYLNRLPDGTGIPTPVTKH